MKNHAWDGLSTRQPYDRGQEMRPNLRQIAEALGISVTTVSRALKDGPEVHPATIERVKQAAREVGYTPNFHGQALRTGRTYTITLILPLETREHLSDLAKVPLIEGMTTAAQERGYSLLVLSTTPEEDPLLSLQRLIQSGATDGVVITRIKAHDPRLEYLRLAKIPFVAFGRAGGRSDYSYVDIDNEGMGRKAVEYLAGKGRRRIALGLLSRDDQSSAMRLSGYRAGLISAGIAFDEKLVGYNEFTLADSERFAASVLGLEDPPDAFICANELGLLGTVSALRERGLVPGKDILLIARDTTGMYRFLSIPIFAHVVDMSNVGSSIVDALIKRVETPEGDPIAQVVEGEFRHYPGPAK